MTLTYIFHSGFVLETDSAILVFDYWLDPSRVMPSVLKKQKPLYVFSSHFHEDHFTKEIFEWRNLRQDITYILSKDILRRRRANKEDADVWLAKGGTWMDECIAVWALGSTDSGVSWIVETEGRRIFHAGDLNNWCAKFLPFHQDVRLDEIVVAYGDIWLMAYLASVFGPPKQLELNLYQSVILIFVYIPTFCITQIIYELVPLLYHILPDFFKADIILLHNRLTC